MSMFANYVPFKRELEKYVGHCKTVFDEIGDRTSGALVDGFIRDLEGQRYNITIIGSLKRGKSTLLNVLMERSDDHISPISSNVCTSAIIKYIDKNLEINTEGKEKAVIYFDDSTQQPATIPLQRIRDYVTEECNPGNQKRVRSVEVFGDFPDWSKAVTIIDSPGQNSVFGHHDVLLSDFLPYTDVIIFLVAADIPLDGGDIALLKELSEEQKKKVLFVLTKVDTIDNPDDLPDVKNFVVGKIQAIGFSCDQLYTVSAKPVYEAIKAGITGVELENLKAENGIVELERDLETFIVSESDQTKILRSRIEVLLEKTGKYFNDYAQSTDLMLSRESYDLTAMKDEQISLTEANKRLRENTKKALKKFGREWSRVINGFQRKFTAKSGAIEDKIIDGLNRGGLIGAVFQSFKLKKQVQKAVGLELQPLVIELEEKLGATIETLNNELDEELALYIKRQAGTDGATAIGSIAALATMAGTVTFGITTTSGAIASAMTAFATWQTAAGGAVTATAANSTAAVGALSKVWAWSFGAGEAAKTATVASTAGANAANAATSAIVAGTTAVVTAGVSIAVTLIVQKLLHIGLVNFQGARVLGIAEGVMSEMEKSLFISLDAYKVSIIKEYEQRIDDMIADNKDRLKEIKEIIVNDNSDERKIIVERLEKVKHLLSEGVQVRKQIPLLLQ